MSVNSISGGRSTAAAPFGPVQGRGQQGQGGPLKDVATLLGTSESDLVDQLRNGSSLDDLASAAGVSHDDLLSAIKKGMPPEPAQSSDVDKIAEDIAVRTGGPVGPPPPDGPGGGRGVGWGAAPVDAQGAGIQGGTLSEAQQKMLDALSSALGTDSTTLLDKLQSGQKLTDIISASGVSTSTLAGVLQDGLLVDAKA